MFEKILQKLKEQRGQNSSVSDRTLNDLAKSYSNIITTDEQLTAFDFAPLIDSINGNISHHSASSVNAFKEKQEEEAKKKKEEEERKKNLQEKANKAAQNAGNAGENGQAPEWMSQFIQGMEAQKQVNERIMQELTGLKTEKVTSTRKTQLDQVLKNMPDSFKKMVYSGFELASFENEDSFNSYLEQVKENAKGLEQVAKEKGLNSWAPPTKVDKKEAAGNETPVLKSALALVEKEKENQKKLLENGTD